MDNKAALFDLLSNVNIDRIGKKIKEPALWGSNLE
jgi:hypothetical protein